MTQGQRERFSDEPGGRAPAPEPLALVQQFINSVDIEGGQEALTSPAALSQWLKERRLLPRTAPAPAQRELDRALDLREALRNLIDDALPGSSLNAAPSVVERAAAAAELTLVIDDQGRLELQPQATGIDGALGRLLAIAFQAQIDGTWWRLRVCANDVCRWAFYDASRNRSGRWCTMAICGNRTKVRIHRLRNT